MISNYIKLYHRWLQIVAESVDSAKTHYRSHDLPYQYLTGLILLPFLCARWAQTRSHPLAGTAILGHVLLTFFRSDHFLDLFRSRTWIIFRLVYLWQDDFDGFSVFGWRFVASQCSMVQENTAGELQDRASKTQETAQILLWNCCPSCFRPLQMQDNRNPLDSK